MGSQKYSDVGIGERVGGDGEGLYENKLHRTIVAAAAANSSGRVLGPGEGRWSKMMIRDGSAYNNSSATAASAKHVRVTRLSKHKIGQIVLILF